MLKKIVIPSLILLTFAFSQPGYTKQLTDAEIKKLLIQESIASYPGNCPCPYNTARNGSSCGRRSAYSKAGGYSPLCYPKDVTPEMVKEYRQSQASR
jgi:hypothetical protein